MVSNWSRCHVSRMQVYQFRSPLGRHSFGFSVDQQGRNLPASLGPWEVVGVHDIDVLNPTRPCGQTGPDARAADVGLGDATAA